MSIKSITIYQIKIKGKIMSIHIMYDHQCSKCEAFYIPYQEGIVCPRCNLDEGEAYDIVPKFVSSALYQLNTMGFYAPIAWWVGSFGDHVALLIFRVLDAFNAADTDDFKKFAQEHFDDKKWGEQLYLKDHICDLSHKVYLAIKIEQQRIVLANLEFEYNHTFGDKK